MTLTSIASLAFPAFAQGLALNDGAMLLAGAVPSAALALLTQGAFALLERWAARR